MVNKRKRKYISSDEDEDYSNSGDDSDDCSSINSNSNSNKRRSPRIEAMKKNKNKNSNKKYNMSNFNLDNYYYYDNSFNNNNKNDNKKNNKKNDNKKNNKKNDNKKNDNNKNDNKKNKKINKHKIVIKKKRKYNIIHVNQKEYEFNNAIRGMDENINNDVFTNEEIMDNYKKKIINLDTTIENKLKIYERLINLRSMSGNENEYPKLNQWIRQILSVPFGQYRELSMNSINSEIKRNTCVNILKEKNNRGNDRGDDRGNNGGDDRGNNGGDDRGNNGGNNGVVYDNFILDAYKKLDESIYGQQNAKNKILQIIMKWISNPSSKGNVLGFSGSKGVGKTSLASQGLAEALNRPCYIIKLGSLTDASYLEGHGYTYDGAICGRIIDIIREAKCMNPIIFFDELDKLSETEKGREIIGYLIHLTDFTENCRYQEDKYFSGITFDLSRALFIFSYNYPERIDPILKDRIEQIDFQTFNTNEKVEIVNRYLLPSIHKTLGIKYLNNSPYINLPTKTIKHIIDTIDSESIRQLKSRIESLYSKLQLLMNLSLETISKINIYNPKSICNKSKLPLNISNEIYDEYGISDTNDI